MVLLAPKDFLKKLKELKDEYASSQKGKIKLAYKNIPSVKVPRLFRKDAIASGERVCLARVYRWKGARKQKISTVVPLKEQLLLHTKIDEIIQDKKNSSSSANLSKNTKKSAK